MKKGIFILLLFFYQNVFCQEYFFDTILEYDYSTTKNPSEGTLFFMVNSKNNGYVFFLNTSDKISQGSIIDFTSKKSYCYKSKDRTEFEYFCANNSIPTLFPEKKSNRQFDFNTEELEGINSKILITKVKTSKSRKRKIIDTITIEIKKNDFVFDYNLLKFFSKQYFNDEDLSFLGNKLPNRISFEYKNGFKRTFKLNKSQKINSLLSTTKKINN